MKLRICTIAAIALAAAPLFGQATEDDGYEPARDHARSVVATRYGIVATSQTLASAAGVKILEAGGHAVDAAIAANAVMGLVEPTGNGIGGDLFAIIWTTSRESFTV
jgi:gamma-glutamyltranspeptidase/glutathione hydrolase